MDLPEFIQNCKNVSQQNRMNMPQMYVLGIKMIISQKPPAADYAQLRHVICVV
jgi:hypothetical protein